MRRDDEFLRWTTGVFDDINGPIIRVVGLKVYELYDGSVEYYGMRFYRLAWDNELELVR